MPIDIVLQTVFDHLAALFRSAAGNDEAASPAVQKRIKKSQILITETRDITAQAKTESGKTRTQLHNERQRQKRLAERELKALAAQSAAVQSGHAPSVGNLAVGV